MNDHEIQDFWEQHPVCDDWVGGLEKFEGVYQAFFKEYDRIRYSRLPHILTCLNNINFNGKETLEIGFGQGSESEQIIRRGALWSGIDLTKKAVDRVRIRFALKNLEYREIKQGSVLDLPFDDNSFDIVFCHGVLHHVPDIDRAQSEIHRVLGPDGKLIVMLYAKWSLNYLLSICILRRIGLIILHLANFDPGGIYGQHLANARAVGLWRYLAMKNFIHKNTDGPLNPYSKVYDRSNLHLDFRSFRIEKIQKRCMWAPPLPVRWMPLEQILGWNLWVHMRPLH